MTPERYRKFKALLDRRQPDLTVLTDQVHKPHNLSAVIRTCDAVGIHDIHLTQPKEGYRDLRGRAMGSHRYVNVHHHQDIRGGIASLKEKGFQILAAHFSETAVPFYDVDYTRPTALILGAEKRGISPEAEALADQHVIIPMQGMVASFNVSVAAAVILVEAQRQRLAKGMYDQPRLDSQIYQPTLFKLGYPELARYCDERNLDYPEIDDEGQLIEPAHWYSVIRNQSKY
ncbi:tRNA (guanosine(18)-2'-O)-methyltransferase TrmH [Endozoicomonas sp. OPT23]|uniref:tRNA (guanosine(18)-2'-O)-methyltransferase TrmH n=1 Tax=Endozoicomonas sp. OPT23 TaxID=2072845 RepID=UPI00129B0709|nr:tRNA (guanosine(18)-2'-O)-methyltransferase TrmH [Endozoicomonas sp. OPT23]MRI33590.1 tRNA (guanosine(18)-2'-O)-methyltransferase TrmH [Endozoicomonas sp. OPT23]